LIQTSHPANRTSNQIKALLKKAIIRLQTEKTATPRCPKERAIGLPQKTLEVKVASKGIKYNGFFLRIFGGLSWYLYTRKSCVSIGDATGRF